MRKKVLKSFWQNYAIINIFMINYVYFLLLFPLSRNRISNDWWPNCLVRTNLRHAQEHLLLGSCSYMRFLKFTTYIATLGNFLYHLLLVFWIVWNMYQFMTYDIHVCIDNTFLFISVLSFYFLFILITAQLPLHTTVLGV